MEHWYFEHFLSQNDGKGKQNKNKKDKSKHHQNAIKGCCQFQFLWCVTLLIPQNPRQQLMWLKKAYLYESDSLFTQEISNFNSFVDKCNIYWEMRIAESHLVEIALCNPGDHILNVGANSTNARKLFSCSEPKINFKRSSIFCQDHVKI